MVDCGMYLMRRLESKFMQLRNKDFESVVIEVSQQSQMLLQLIASWWASCQPYHQLAATSPSAKTGFRRLSDKTSPTTFNSSQPSPIPSHSPKRFLFSHLISRPEIYCMGDVDLRCLIDYEP